MKFIDPDIDPYVLLKQHDRWITLFAEHMEKMAQATMEHARTIDEQASQIQHLAQGWNYHEQQIDQLRQRITELEKKCEHR
jgi:uncharacterized protein YceH (UPF0502 family)